VAGDTDPTRLILMPDAKNMKFAAIDVGSNAVRLLLARVYEKPGEPIVKKESLVRIPIRLGDDVFLKNAITKKKVENLINAMVGFKYLIDAYESLDYAACATSAMREAENGEEIAKEIKKKSGIDLEIVDGRKEAEIICANHAQQNLNGSGNYLHVDVGGGSTEITVFRKTESITSKSFKIGAIRVLNNLVQKSDWQEMKSWLKENTKDFQPITAIGSGGNINKIFRMSHEDDNKPISDKKIKEILDHLNSYSFEQRVMILKIREDRADVIIPAAEIYLSVMRWSSCEKIYVPQIGLSDGLIHILYEKYKASKAS
jgi:exopolyphosphatase/guanosine-5'-triphosphate,3'-diphosphate pyrophosphatase